MDNFDEHVLLHGENFKLDIPVDSYLVLLRTMSNNSLIDHYRSCLVMERYENLVYVKLECDDRQLEIIITDKNISFKTKNNA